jgi:hypothetical protein
LHKKKKGKKKIHIYKKKTCFIVVQGTDWGSTIGKAMALNYPNHCLGYHTNMPIVAPPIPTLHNILTSPLQVIMFLLALVLGTHVVYKSQDIRLFRAFANADVDDGAGYRAIQSTRPYTLAYGLSDSPVGLLGNYIKKMFLYLRTKMGVNRLAT